MRKQRADACPCSEFAPCPWHRSCGSGVRWLFTVPVEDEAGPRLEEALWSDGHSCLSALPGGCREPAGPTPWAGAAAPCSGLSLALLGPFFLQRRLPPTSPCWGACPDATRPSHATSKALPFLCALSTSVSYLYLLVTLFPY